MEDIDFDPAFTRVPAGGSTWARTRVHRGELATYGTRVRAWRTSRTTRANSSLNARSYHGHADLVEVAEGPRPPTPRVNDRGQTPLAGCVFKGRGRVGVGTVARRRRDPAPAARKP